MNISLPQNAENPSPVWDVIVTLTGLALSLSQPVAHPRLLLALSLGEDLRNGLRLAGPDPISANALPSGNLSSEWLFDIVAASLYRSGGELAWLAARSLLWVMLSWLLWRFLSRRLSVPVSLALTGLSFISLLPYAPLSPALITAVGLVWVASEAAAYEAGRRKHLWHLPFLFLLWSSLHRGSVLGVIGLACLLCLSPDPSRHKRRPGLLGACALALLMTPGARFLWLYPTYLGLGPIARLTGENTSPDFRLLSFRAAELLLLALWARWIVTASPSASVGARQGAEARFCLTPTLAFIALLYTKSAVPLFVAVSLYGLASSEEVRGDRTGGRFVVTAFIGLIGTLILWRAWSQPEAFHRWFPTDHMPVEGAKRIRHLVSEGRLAYPVVWGGYINWALDEKAFIDIRSEVYGRRFLEDYRKLTNLSPGWEEVLDRYHVRAVLWSRNVPLCQLLEAHPGWKRVYADPVSAIIVRHPDKEATNLAEPRAYYAGRQPASRDPQGAGSGAGRRGSCVR